MYDIKQKEKNNALIIGEAGVGKFGVSRKISIFINQKK